MSSPAKPHSCKLCESRLILTFGNYYSDQGWYELIDENYFATGEAYVFNIAYDEAVSLADQGCELFKWLVTLRRDDTHSESYLRAYFAHNSREQMVLDWVDELDDHIDGGTLKRKLIVCAEKSELAAEEVTYRPPNLFPSSNETVETIKSWLQECFTTHAECQQLQKSNRPSDGSLTGPRRLLHLSGKAAHPQVRLQENSSSSVFVEYAALSYCWGGDQLVTLKENLVKSWIKDIPYDQFPQTIKDAIQVTMALDLQYLWIDALCIIQDSNQDKAEQISRMAEIYEQAYITISAARATAVPEGFLHDRYVAGEKGFRMPFTCQNGQTSAVILWQGREPDAWEPIDQRSWCLQESILSPRVLEYRTHNIRWHCARSRADESKLQSDGWVGHSRTFAQQTCLTHSRRASIGRAWVNLTTISAIARKMNKMTDKHYIAGLWTEFLGETLLWHPNHGPDAKEKASRHATYVAPSWSWASFSGEIDFTFGSTMHLLELVRCEVKTQIPSDEFSSVTSARLEIKTLTFQARIRKGFYGWFLWDEQMKDEIDGSLMFDVVEADVDGEVVEDEELLLALIMTQDALMLKKKGVEEHVRIGIFREGQRMTNRVRWEMGQVVMVVPAKINYLCYFNAVSTKQWQTIKIRMETPNDTQTNTIVEIAPRGDLILVVGPEKAKLHVKSTWLREVSKPFSAMFRPDWKEGRDLLDCDRPVDRPTEIPLPEDNAAAMKIICSVIHHQRSEVPRTLAADDVLAVAVAADKYDCVEALELASDRWLRPSGDEAGNLMLLTAAAYLFQNAQAFKELTKALILDYKDPYLTLSCREVESAMPWKVFCLLEEQRGSARLRVAEILLAGVNDGTGCWKTRIFGQHT
ncbi:hypothetical protein THAR02_01535 [Trichoderma harzianum]|uniref:Heterokaryon incompatibility domain-containing protein n=1 Tax=Trichoderma harzianum TaxID=5544 RepID=A0A0G0A262_TRIHA|nr:hypothetical protein THAR02_01535 [Trichoderma harzianum]